MYDTQTIDSRLEDIEKRLEANVRAAEVMDELSGLFEWAYRDQIPVPQTFVKRMVKICEQYLLEKGTTEAHLQTGIAELDDKTLKGKISSVFHSAMVALGPKEAKEFLIDPENKAFLQTLVRNKINIDAMGDYAHTYTNLARTFGYVAQSEELVVPGIAVVSKREGRVQEPHTPSGVCVIFNTANQPLVQDGERSNSIEHVLVDNIFFPWDEHRRHFPKFVERFQHGAPEA